MMQFNNIQGCINARVVRLHSGSDKNSNKLELYKKTLTEGQIAGAREHLKTVLEIKNNKKRFL